MVVHVFLHVMVVHVFLHVMVFHVFSHVMAGSCILTCHGGSCPLTCHGGPCVLNHGGSKDQNGSCIDSFCFGVFQCKCAGLVVSKLWLKLPVFGRLIRLGLTLRVGRHSCVLGVHWLNLGTLSSLVAFWEGIGAFSLQNPGTLC